MMLKRMVFIGLCLVLGLGLILVNMGLCQANKPGESPPPAVSPGGQTPAPPASKPETGKEAKPAKPESKAAPPSQASPAPEQKEAQGKRKLPRRFVPSEGC